MANKRTLRSPVYQYYNQVDAKIFKCKRCEYYATNIANTHISNQILFNYLYKNNINNYQHYYLSQKYVFNEEASIHENTTNYTNNLWKHLSNEHKIINRPKEPYPPKIESIESKIVEVVLFMINKNLNYNQLGSKEFAEISGIHISDETLEEVLKIVCFYFLF